MEKKRADFYEDERPFEVNLEEYIERILIEVESFLNKVHSNDQTSLQVIINDLKNRVESKEIVFRTPDGDFPLLSKYADLRKVIISYLLNPFEIYQTITKNTETITVTVRSWLRSRLFLYYQMAKSLTSTLSKEEAIQFFQNYIDEKTRALRDPANFSETLEKFYLDNTFFETYAGHNLIFFKINNWKAGEKILKCKWHEVMKELNDPDFSYAVACHYDFEAIKNKNPAFVLTRTRTLMEGRECCDFCYHDTRNTEVTHPSEDFWTKLK